ncbi:MAG TPA: 23S rRNA (guanosine(2251)-2'-O)-methyltransferase RlmB [Ignavibacteria bacterium]|nr:23S rRNA (guanosine(2251)-2'-O)-methyltransferase RlmB [Ignavibacteria bacterium]
MLVIGKNPVYEILVTTPKELNKIVLLKTIKPEPKLKKMVKLAEENGINVIMLNRYDFEKFFNRNNKKEGISQGVLGFIKDFEYVPIKEMIDGIKEKGIVNPVVVLLDEITDPHNMGAIIRSAVCLGADGVIIPRHNSAEVNHTVFKSSSGAISHIPIARETNLAHSIEYLKKNGYWVIGTEMKTDKTIFNTDLKMPLGLVIGNEGTGMRDIIRKNCDILIRIPMAGKLDSLNASVSAAVVLYEIFRQKNS